MTTITADLALDIAPLSGTIGAEICNLDLHQPLGPDDGRRHPPGAARLQGDLLSRPHLSAAEHKQFALHFGEITNAHPVIPGIGEHREVFEIDYTKTREMPASGKKTVDYGERDKWHTDVTFVETPPLGSILNAIVIPEAGGDTLWADTQAAYEGLSPADQGPRRRPHCGARRHHAFGRLLETLGKESGTARNSPSWCRPSTRWCAPIPRPADAACSSTRALPSRSRA